jgi:hypothetical protein
MEQRKTEAVRWRRLTGGRQRWDTDKMHRECPLYSCVSRRGNAYPRKERGREVTARLGSARRGGRASVRSRDVERSEGSNDRAGMEATLKGVLPVRQW